MAIGVFFLMILTWCGVEWLRFKIKNRKLANK